MLLPIHLYCWQKLQIQKYKQDAAPLPPPPQPWWTRAPASLLLGDPLPGHQHHQGVRPGKLIKVHDHEHLQWLLVWNICFDMRRHHTKSSLLGPNCTSTFHFLFFCDGFPKLIKYDLHNFLFSVMVSLSWLWFTQFSVAGSFVPLQSGRVDSRTTNHLEVVP